MASNVGHRFRGVHRTAAGLWVGRCSCGEPQIPGSKDNAWDEIADHIIQSNPELSALRDQAVMRRMLLVATATLMRRELERRQHPTKEVPEWSTL